MSSSSRRALRADAAATAGIALGGFGAIAVAGFLVPWRDRIGQTNVAAPVPRRAIQRFRDSGFELPAEGAEVVVQYGGDVLGRLVIVPSHAVGVRILERQVAVAIADLDAASIAAHGDADPQ